MRKQRHRGPARPGGPIGESPSRAGFSLMEVLVSLAVMMVVTLAGLTLVDTGQRVMTAQTAISELQNNQRVVHQQVIRMLGMAGVGGLPEGIDPSLGGVGTAGVFPHGLALGVINNVGPETHIGDDATPLIVEGSDVLTLRGVFSTPAYLIDPQVPLALDADGRVSLVISSEVEIGVRQDLESLRRELAAATAAGAERPEAFIVRDRYNPGAYAVLELDPAATVPGDPGDPTLTIGLILSSNSGDQQYADEYGRMILGTSLLQGAGGAQVTLPDDTEVQLPRVIGSIGLLEEHRFYVRQAWEVSGDPTSRSRPVLSRIRFYPGTGAVHPEGSVDIADDVLDLQVALGVDLPPVDGRIADGFDADGLAVSEDLDEVLYNHPDDDDGLSPPPGSRAWAIPAAKVAFARVTTVVQAARPDRAFEGARLGVLEDHDLTASTYNDDPHRKVRKHTLRTLVELRNLP